MEVFTRFTVFMIFMIFLIHGNSWFMKSGAEALRTAVVPRLMHAVQNASTRKAWIVSQCQGSHCSSSNSVKCKTFRDWGKWLKPHWVSQKSRSVPWQYVTQVAYNKPLHGCRASLVSLVFARSEVVLQVGTEAVVPYDARPCSKAGRDERRSTDVETLTSLEKSQWFGVLRLFSAKMHGGLPWWDLHRIFHLWHCN